jgi:peptidyl-prolyl cis-trans isomerase SurA
VVITDEMIKDFYKKNYAANVKDHAYHILQMGFVPKKEGDSINIDDAKQRAEEARQKAVSGQDFRVLARQFSDFPSARDGGDLGVFKEDEMAGAMKDSILSMQPGEISPVIKMRDGFQFFKLLSDRGHIKAQASLESVRNEIEANLFDLEMNKHFEKWVKELREEAYIKKML